MPRASVDRTEILRIELGGKERDLAVQVSTAYMVARLAQPITVLMTSLTGIGALFLLISAIWPTWSKDLPEGWQAAVDGMDDHSLWDYVDGLNLAMMATGAASGAYVGSVVPFWGTIAGAVLGAFGGAIVAEGIEEVSGDVKYWKLAASRPILMMLMLRKIAKDQDMIG